MQDEFKIEGEYIELMQLLKVIGLAQTGGNAKMIVDSGIVLRNGEIETRRRAKIRSGEQIKIKNHIIDLK
jgi:ribosome-associated protein